jgi:glycosyltransferase involved in cell wall biosynthesis
MLLVRPTFSIFNSKPDVFSIEKFLPGQKRKYKMVASHSCIGKEAMDYPRFSVIVPTLNEEKYLPQTLASVKRQDYKGEFEIIVADGMSQDRTVDVARRYTDRIVLVNRKGVSAGRNEGAKVATGDILVFLDADTIACDNLLTNIYKNFRHKNVLAGTPRILTTEYGKTMILYTIANELGINALFKIKKPIMPAVCLACRKDVFWKIGGFNEDLKVAEDVEFSAKIRKLQGKFVFMRNTYVYTSPRRLKKWGVVRQLKAWPFGYIQIRFRNRQPKYEPIR